MKIQTTIEKVNEGIEAIRAKGGSVKLNEEQDGGRVSVQGVVATFSFIDGLLIVKVLDKPWLASMDYVESEIKKFFA